MVEHTLCLVLVFGASRRPPLGRVASVAGDRALRVQHSIETPHCVGEEGARHRRAALHFLFTIDHLLDLGLGEQELYVAEEEYPAAPTHRLPDLLPQHTAA